MLFLNRIFSRFLLHTFSFRKCDYKNGGFQWTKFLLFFSFKSFLIHYFVIIWCLYFCCCSTLLLLLLDCIYSSSIFFYFFIYLIIYIVFFAFKPLRVGVEGRFGLAEPIFFLSDGFKIWNEHISVSSTLIIAPALSNSPQ